MSEVPVDTVLMTGDMVPTPEGITYVPLTDHHLRALIVSHMIRTGVSFQVGVVIGFSVTVKVVDAPSVAEVVPSQGTPISDSVWHSIEITADDIIHAHALINQQKAAFRRHDGVKISQVDLTEGKDQ